MEFLNKKFQVDINDNGCLPILGNTVSEKNMGKVHKWTFRLFIIF